MQETKDRRGLCEWRADSEGQVSLLSRSLRSSLQGGCWQDHRQTETMRGEKMCRARGRGAQARTSAPRTSRDHFRHRGPIRRAKAAGPVQSEAWVRGPAGKEAQSRGGRVAWGGGPETEARTWTPSCDKLQSSVYGNFLGGLGGVWIGVLGLVEKLGVVCLQNSRVSG